MNLKNIQKVEGSYYPLDPEKNPLNKDLRIDFTYNGEKLYFTGSQKEIMGDELREIIG